MGRALARAFIEEGHQVTVWNRTRAASEGLGASRIAESPADAFAASELTVICVLNNDVIDAFMDENAKRAARGKTVLNLNTSTPEDANKTARLFTEVGATYLDGTIPAFPDQIGKSGAGVIVAGPEQKWEQIRDVLGALGGATWYAGEKISAPAVIDMAMAISFFHTALGAFIESATYALREGVSIDSIKRAVPALIPVLEEQISVAIDAISKEDFSTDQATVDVHLGAVQMASKVMEKALPGRALLASIIANDLAKASSAGHGGNTMASIIKVL